MPNPPASSALPLSQIPSWGEVESDPQFVAADKPTQLAAFNNWRNMLLDASLGDENAFTREDFDRFQVFSRRKAAELSGSPTWQQDADRSVEQYRAEEEARQKLLQDSLSRKPLAPLTEAATLGFDLAQAAASPAAGALAQLPGMVEGLIAAPEEKERDTLRKVFQDEEDFAVFNGRFVASPSLVLDRDKYKKAVAESSLDRDAKIRAMAELGELRDQVAASVSDNMLKTESTYGEGLIGIGNDFTKMRDYELSRNPQATEADIVEKWRKQNDHWWKNPMKQVFLGARMAGTSLVQQYYGLKSLAGLADEMDENRLTAATQQLGELGEASKNIGGATLASQASSQVLQMAPLVALGPVGRGAGALVSGAAARTAARAGFALTGRAASSLASGAVSRVGLQLPRIRALLAEKQTAGQIAKTLGLAEAEVAPVAKMLLREQAIHSAGGQAAVVLASGLQAAGSSYPEIRDQVLSDLSSTLDKEDPEYEAKLAQAEKTAVDTATYQALRRGFVTMAVTWAGNKLGGDTGEAALAGSGTLRGVSRGTAKALKDNFAVYLFKTAGKEVVPEAIEEASDSLVNGLVDKMTYDPNRSIGDIASDVFESGAWGGFLGGFFGGVKAAANYSAEKQAALRAKPVADLLSASKGLEETGSPQTAAELRKQAGELAERTAAARLAAGLAPVEEAPPTSGVSFPMMVTRDMRQQLADLGYTQADINQLTPQAAANLIQSGLRKPPVVETAAPAEAPPPAPAPRAATRPGEAPIAAAPTPVEEVPPPAPAPRAATRPGEPPRIVNAPLDPADKRVEAPILAKDGFVLFARPDGTRYKLRDNSKTPPEWQNALGKKVRLKGFGTGNREDSFFTLGEPRTGENFGAKDAPVGDTVYEVYEEDFGRTIGNKSATELFQEGWTFVESDKSVETTGTPQTPSAEAPLPAPAPRAATRPSGAPPAAEATTLPPAPAPRAATQTANGKKRGDKIVEGENIEVLAEDDQSTPGMPSELTVLEVDGILDSKSNKVFARRRDMTPDEITVVQEKIRQRNALAKEMGMPQIEVPQPITPQGTPTSATEGPAPAPAPAPEPKVFEEPPVPEGRVRYYRFGEALPGEEALTRERPNNPAVPVSYTDVRVEDIAALFGEEIPATLPERDFGGNLQPLPLAAAPAPLTVAEDAAGQERAARAKLDNSYISILESGDTGFGSDNLIRNLRDAAQAGATEAELQTLVTEWEARNPQSAAKARQMVADSEGAVVPVSERLGAGSPILQPAPAALPAAPELSASQRAKLIIDRATQDIEAEAAARLQDNPTEASAIWTEANLAAIRKFYETRDEGDLPETFTPELRQLVKDRLQAAIDTVSAPPAPSATPQTPASTATPVAAETQTPTPTTPDASIQRNIPEDRQQERIQTDEGRQAAETGGGNRPLVSGQVEGQGQAENVIPAATPGVGVTAPTPAKSPEQALSDKAAELRNRLNSLDPENTVSDSEYEALVDELMRVEADLQAIEDAKSPAPEAEAQKTLTEVVAPPARKAAKAKAGDPIKKVEKLVKAQKGRPISKSKLSLIGAVLGGGAVNIFNTRAEAEAFVGQTLPPGKYGATVPTQDGVVIVLFADELAEEGAPAVRDVLFHEGVHFAEELLLRSDPEARKLYADALPVVRDAGLIKVMEEIYPGFGAITSDDVRMAEVVQAIIEGKLTSDLVSLTAPQKTGFSKWIKALLKFIRGLVGARPALLEYTNALEHFLGDFNTQKMAQLITQLEGTQAAVVRPPMFASAGEKANPLAGLRALFGPRVSGHVADGSLTEEVLGDSQALQRGYPEEFAKISVRENSLGRLSKAGAGVRQNTWEHIGDLYHRAGSVTDYRSMRSKVETFLRAFKEGINDILVSQVKSNAIYALTIQKYGRDYTREQFKEVENSLEGKKAIEEESRKLRFMDAAFASMYERMQAFTPLQAMGRNMAIAFGLRRYNIARQLGEAILSTIEPNNDAVVTAGFNSAGVNNLKKSDNQTKEQFDLLLKIGETIEKEPLRSIDVFNQISDRITDEELLYPITLAKEQGAGLQLPPLVGKPATARQAPPPRPRPSPETAARVRDLQRSLLQVQKALEDPQLKPNERRMFEQAKQTLTQEIASLSRANAVSAPLSEVDLAAEFATEATDVPVDENVTPPDWTYEGDTRPETLRKIDAYVVPNFVKETVDRGLVQWGWENGRPVIRVNKARLRDKIRKQREAAAAKLGISKQELDTLNLSVDISRHLSFANAVMSRIQEEYQARFPAEEDTPTSLWTGGRVEGDSTKFVRGDPSKIEKAKDRDKLYSEGLFPSINRLIPQEVAQPARAAGELSSKDKAKLEEASYWPFATKAEFEKEQALRQAAATTKNKKAAAKLRSEAAQVLADNKSRRFSVVTSGLGKGSVPLNSALEKSPVHSLPEGTKLYRVLSYNEQAPRRNDKAGDYYALRTEGTNQVMPAQHVTTDLAEAKAHAALVGGAVMEVRSAQVRKVGDNLIVPGGTFEVVQRSGDTFIIQQLEGAPRVIVQGFFTNVPEVTAMQISKGYSVFVPPEVGDAVHPHIEYDPNTRLVKNVKVAALGSDAEVSIEDGPDAYAQLWNDRRPIGQRSADIAEQLSALEQEYGMSLTEAKDQLYEVTRRVQSLEREGNQLKNLDNAKQEQLRLLKIVRKMEKQFATTVWAERPESVVPVPENIKDPAELEQFAAEEAAQYQRAVDYMRENEADLIARHADLAGIIASGRLQNAVVQTVINTFRKKQGAGSINLDLVTRGVVRSFYRMLRRADPFGGDAVLMSLDAPVDGSTGDLLAGSVAAPEALDAEEEPLTNDEKSLLGIALSERVLDGDPDRTLRVLSRNGASNEELATARQILELHRRGAAFTVAAQTGEVTLTYGPELTEVEMEQVSRLLPKVNSLGFSGQTARKFPNLARILVRLHEETVTALLEITQKPSGNPLYSAGEINQMSLEEMVTIAKNTSGTGMLEHLDIVRYQIATLSGIESPFLAPTVEGLPTAQEALAQIQEDLRRPDLSPEDRQRLEQERETLTKTIENAKTLQAARLRGKRLAEQSNFDELRNNLRSLLGPMFDMPADPETPRFSKEALQRFREELQRFGVDATNWRDDNESSMTLSPQSSRRLFNYFRLQFKGANKALTSALAELIETINDQFEVVISTVANGNTSDPVTWVGTQLFVDLNAFPIPADGDTARVMEQFALHVQQAVLQRMTREALDRALGGAFAKAESIGEGSHPTLKALEELRAEAERVLGEDFPRETSTVREFVLSLYNSPTFVRALNEQKAAGGTGFKGLLSRVSRFIAQLLMDFLNPAAKIKVNLGSVYHTAVVESLRLMSLSPSNGVKTAALLNKLFFVPESGTPVAATVIKSTSPAIAAAKNETNEDVSDPDDKTLEQAVEEVTNDEVPVSGPQTSSPGTNPNASVVLKPSGAPPALPAQRAAALSLVTSILEEVDSNTPLQATVAPEGTGLTLWVTGNRDSNVIHVDVNNLAQVVTEWRDAGMSEADIKRRLRAGLEEEVDHLEIHRRFSDTDLIRIGLGMDPAERRNLARSIAGPDASPAEVARAAGDGPNMTPLEQAKAMAILADEHLRRTRQRVRSGFTTEDVRAITKTEPRSLNRVLAYLTAYFRRVAARWNASADPVSLRAALNTASFLSANGMTVDQITGGIPDIAERLIATAAASTAYGDARFGTAQRTKKDLESGMFDGAAKEVREAMEALADMEVDYDSLTEPELIKRAGELVEKHTVSGPMTGDDMKALTAKIRDDVSVPERVRHVAKAIVLEMARQAATKATDPDVKGNFRAAEAAILVEVTKEASAFGANLRSVQTAQDKILDPHRAVATYGTSFIRGTKATLKTMGVDKIVEEIERELGDPAKISGGVVDGVVGEDVRKASVKAKAKKKGVSDKDIAEAEQEAVELEDASRLPLDDLAEAVAKAMLERVSKRLRGRLSPAEEDALFKQILAEVSRQIISRLSDGDPDKKKPVRRTVWTRFLENAEDIDILEKAFDASTEKLRRELAPGGNPNFNGPPTQEQVDKLTRTLALLEGARAEVLPMKDARKLVRQSFRFREEVKAHVSDQLASVASLTKMLVEVGELDETQAKLVAKYIEIAYEEEKAKYIQKLIERYKRSDLAASASTVVDKLSRSEELAQFARMGAFRSEEFYSAIARSLELPTYDTKVVEQLEADLAAINAMPKDSIQRLDAGRELSSKVADLILKQLVSSNSLKGLLQKHPEVLWTYLVEIPTSMWKAGILSGFGTQQVNLVFGSLQSIMDLTNNAVGYAMTAPKGNRASLMARNLFTIFKSALLLDPATRAETITEMKRALFTGSTRFQSEQTESLSRLERDLPLVGKITKPYSLLGRVMMVIDALVGVPANMARQRMAIAHLATKQGYDADQMRELLSKAFSPEETVMRQIENQLDGEASSFALSKNPALMREARRNELLEQYRDSLAKNLSAGADIVTEGRISANVANLSSQPKGFAGWVMDGIFGSLERKTRGATSLLVPFARSLANMLDFSLAMSFFPVSFLRAYNMSPSSWMPDSMISETYRRQQVERGSQEFYKLMSQGFMSTFLTAGLAMAVFEMFRAMADDEEPFIAVYGDGPADAEKRNQLRLRAPFWKPNVLKIGSFYANWKDLPGINLLLGGIAALSDSVINAQEKGRKVRPSQFAVNSMIQLTRAMFAKQPLQGLEDASKLLFGRAEGGASLDKVLMKMASSWVGGVTNPRILRDVEDMTRGLLSETGETPMIETAKTWSDALQSVLPGSSLLFDRPAILNARGKEVTSFWFAPFTKRLLPDMESPHTDEIITPLVSAGLYLSPPESQMSFKTWKDPEDRAAGIDPDGAILSSFDSDVAREALILYGEQMTAMLQSGNVINNLVRFAERGQVEREAAQKALDSISSAARKYAQSKLQRRILDGELLPHWQQ